MAVARLAADLIIRNARVHTLDPADPVAEAVAFRGDEIVGVGSDEEIRPLRDARTREVDGDGGAVLPGFTDSHTHLHGCSLARAYHVDYAELSPASMVEVLAAIHARAERTPRGQWIRGENFNEHQLDRPRLPTRGDLDRVTAGHPVVISSIGNHVAMANSMALSLAGIDRDTPDPPGGHIDRDDCGEPTGVLRERARLRLDARRADTVVPHETASQRVEALAKGVAMFNRHGVAAIHEIIRRPEEIADYQALRADGRLTLRVQLLIRAYEAQISLGDIAHLGLSPGFGDDRLSLGGIKISVDGVCIGRNAAVYDPYPGQPDNVGIARIKQEELDPLVAEAHRAGFRVAVHAIGQRAVDMAIDAFRRAGAGPGGPRHSIEHAYLPPLPGQLEAMRDLGLVLSTQPGFMRSFGDGWTNVFGPDALHGVMPLRRALNLGIRVQANSDYACSPPNPLVGIQCAIVRRTARGARLDPSQAIGVEEAIRMFTTVPAHTGGEEATRGTLSVGKRADAVVLDGDPFETEPEVLDRIRVRATVVGGELVYAS